MKLLIMVLCLFVVACSLLEPSAVIEAKKAIEARLTDPASVQYRNIKQIPSDLVCGELNAKNTMGGYTGFQKFIYNSNSKQVKLDVSDFQYSMCIAVNEYLLQQFEAHCAEGGLADSLLCDRAKEIKERINWKAHAPF